MRFFITALLSLSFVAHADTLEQRYLARAIITHCQSQQSQPPVVIMPDGSEVPTVIGEPIPTETTCIHVDTRVDQASMSGSLLVWSGEAGVITQVIIDAEVHSGGRLYRFADWVDAISYAGSGAVYDVVSRLRDDEDRLPLEYAITFIRRTPNECLESTGVIGPCRDRTTMIQIEIAPGTFAQYDFRPE